MSGRARGLAASSLHSRCVPVGGEDGLAVASALTVQTAQQPGGAADLPAIAAALLRGALAVGCERRQAVARTSRATPGAAPSVCCRERRS